MSDTRTEQAARLLIEARRGGHQIKEMAEECLPRSEAEAYAIQRAVLARFGPAGSWKVGAKGPQDAPSGAPIFADLIHPSPARFPRGRFHQRGIEAEIAFRLGRDLAGRGQPYSREEVTAAVDAALPAIEVVSSRLLDFRKQPPLLHLADNLANGALVVGAPVADWRGMDFAKQVARLRVDGAVRAETVGGNPAGDLIRLLVWLVNIQAQGGRGLPAGTIVTTGSCTGLLFVEEGARVEAELPGLGSVAVEFAA